jgi:hypothetical protein
MARRPPSCAGRRRYTRSTTEQTSGSGDEAIGGEPGGLDGPQLLAQVAIPSWRILKERLASRGSAWRPSAAARTPLSKIDKGLILLQDPIICSRSCRSNWHAREGIVKDPVEPNDLENLEDEHLATIEKIIQRELHNVTQARDRLEKALADIRKKRAQGKP